jgi:hypothetical protein
MTVFAFLPEIQNKPWRNSMSEPTGAAPRRGISLDVYAVSLALILALLVRFNLIPTIKW